uniref:alpha/beta fold hydrolase n=1 Tax=Streptomyces sp. YIM 98790 TaxID=2689077 RepID=UPI00140A5091
GPAAGALSPAALARVLARSLVASATAAELAEDAAVLPDGTARDAVTARLAAALGAPAEATGTERAVPSFVTRPLLRLATRSAVRRRRALTDAAHPAAGDILVYLTRGEPLRAGLRALVGALDPPVVLIGHSLGGIIALDTLIGEPLPQVRLLVTVGSQAPFLYETGALPGLAHPEPLPDRMPPWLNIYDRRDLLAYIGAPLFPGRVTDAAVDSRQPFPAAHSAYWTHRAVYRTIADRLP